jgi:hypothetical protein
MNQRETEALTQLLFSSRLDPRTSPSPTSGMLLATTPTWPSSGAYPPPSFSAVCGHLGVNQTVAKRRCPDLAAEFMSRYRLFQTEAKRTREKFRKVVAESAVNQLLTEGRPLSYNQLSKVLPPGISAADRLVRLEFKRLRKEAEDEMQTVMQQPVVPVP